MKWSEFKALVEAEIEKYSLDDPDIYTMDFDTEELNGVVYEITAISLVHDFHVYEVLYKRPE